MRKTIHTDKAPGAIGPYSQAIAATSGTMLFTAGQVALDPQTMQLVGTTAAEQATQVMANLGAVLRAGGADFSAVVKTTIYLANFDDFAAVNQVYGSFFTADPPARSTVQVCRLPKDALVEIDMIAMLP